MFVPRVVTRSPRRAQEPGGSGSLNLKGMSNFFSLLMSPLVSKCLGNRKMGGKVMLKVKKSCIFTMEHTNKYGRFSQKIQVLQLPLIIQGN